MKKVQEKRTGYFKHLIGRINYFLFLNPNDKEIQEYHTYLF